MGKHSPLLKNFNLVIYLFVKKNLESVERLYMFVQNFFNTSMNNNNFVVSISEEGIAHLRKNTLPKSAPLPLRMMEGMAFADTAKELSLYQLIQVAGLRDKNIAHVAALAIVEFHTSLN